MQVKEALDKYTAALKNGIPYDLVILDMVMPGMGGGETFDELKKIDPDVKVEAVSIQAADSCFVAGELTAWRVNWLHSG